MILFQKSDTNLLLSETDTFCFIFSFTDTIYHQKFSLPLYSMGLYKTDTGKFLRFFTT